MRDVLASLKAGDRRKLERYARKTGRPMSELVTQAVTSYVRQLDRNRKYRQRAQSK